MSKTAILTDSASDIPRELEEKYGIDILPFQIVVDGQSYTERVDFTCEVLGMSFALSSIS